MCVWNVRPFIYTRAHVHLLVSMTINFLGEFHERNHEGVARQLTTGQDVGLDFHETVLQVFLAVAVAVEATAANVQNVTDGSSDE